MKTNIRKRASLRATNALFAAYVRGLMPSIHLTSKEKSTIHYQLLLTNIDSKRYECDDLLPSEVKQYKLLRNSLKNLVANAPYYCQDCHNTWHLWTLKINFFDCPSCGYYIYSKYFDLYVSIDLTNSTRNCTFGIVKGLHE
jgi:lipopolysaccharide biosynthesis regulator YciM